MKDHTRARTDTHTQTDKKGIKNEFLYICRVQTFEVKTLKELESIILLKQNGKYVSSS